jgi:stage III sporulation protein SpoIIIAA
MGNVQDKIELAKAREQIIYLHKRYAAPSNMTQEDVQKYIERVKRYVEAEENDKKQKYTTPPKSYQVFNKNKPSAPGLVDI